MSKAFNLQPGEIATYKGANVVIRKFIDLENVIIENISTGKSLTWRFRVM